jgi:hypothetical protein
VDVGAAPDIHDAARNPALHPVRKEAGDLKEPTARLPARSWGDAKRGRSPAVRATPLGAGTARSRSRRALGRNVRLVSSAEIRLVLVESDGRERARAAISHPAEVRVGQELWLDVEGSRRLVRVLRQETADRGERLVHAIEVLLRCPFCRADLLAADGLAGLERDAGGECVTCRRCGRRVAMERVPTTPPGGPTRLRVAAEQEGWEAWE